MRAQIATLPREAATAMLTTTTSHTSIRTRWKPAGKSPIQRALTPHYPPNHTYHLVSHRRRLRFAATGHRSCGAASTSSAAGCAAGAAARGGLSRRAGDHSRGNRCWCSAPSDYRPTNSGAVQLAATGAASASSSSSNGGARPCGGASTTTRAVTRAVTLEKSSPAARPHVHRVSRLPSPESWH